MITYMVIEHTKTVVAILKNTQNDFIKEICKQHNKSIINISKNQSKDFLLSSQFRGTVHFGEDEEFDIKLGKRIAKERVLTKYYAQKDKKYRLYLKCLSKLYSNIYNDVFNKNSRGPIIAG